MSKDHYIDMGTWMCRAKFIDPKSVKRDGSRVSIKIGDNRRTKDCKTPEKAELFKHEILKRIKEATGEAPR